MEMGGPYQELKGEERYLSILYSFGEEYPAVYLHDCTVNKGHVGGCIFLPCVWRGCPFLEG